jgi:hypothetical protein
MGFDLVSGTMVAYDGPAARSGAVPQSRAQRGQQELTEANDRLAVAARVAAASRSVFERGKVQP